MRVEGGGGVWRGEDRCFARWFVFGLCQQLIDGGDDLLFPVAGLRSLQVGDTEPPGVAGHL